MRNYVYKVNNLRRISLGIVLEVIKELPTNEVKWKVYILGFQFCIGEMNGTIQNTQTNSWLVSFIGVYHMYGCCHS